MNHRKLTVIITGCTTDSLSFQWYRNNIGDKFEVVNQDGLNWYRVLSDEHGVFFKFIHKSDCKTIEEYRDSKLKELGI
jgi:hypothetical protein